MTSATRGGFQVRHCPLCASPDGRVVFDLEADDFCRVNWTYSKDFRSILGLATPARFPVDRCTGCGFLYARLLPSAEFLKAVYEEVILSAECRCGSENLSSYSRRLRYVSTLLGLADVSGKTVRKGLDFGAGLGVTLRVFNAVNVEAWGFDPSPSRQAYVASAGLSVATTFAQLRGAAPFDLLVCDNVLEHLPDPLAVVRSLGELLAPGALAFVSVPDYGVPMIERQLSAQRHGRPLDMTLNPWEHLGYFSLRHLDSILGVAGLERVAAHAIPEPVNVGLRPEPSPIRRLKNSLASAARLGTYALTGRAVESTGSAFYRKALGPA